MKMRMLYIVNGLKLKVEKRYSVWVAVDFKFTGQKNNKLLFGKTNNKKKIRAMLTFMHWESKNSWKGQDQALNMKWYKSRPIADGGLNYTLEKNF